MMHKIVITPNSGNTIITDSHHTAQTYQRRGSVLILVVGVLVLLAISATIYIGVGRNERISAAAQESVAIQSESINKIADYVGQVLTDDLFAVPDGVTTPPTMPFLDGTEVRPDWRVGERWDYPYTRAGSNSTFNILADPWLASTEPINNTTWEHLSNYNKNGTFIDLAELVDKTNYNNFNIYGPVTITGVDPIDLDSPIKSSHPSLADFAYNQQMDDVTDEGFDGYPTYLDQRFGTDTDGDGRMDARWTELPDIYGMPQGMRVFVALRTIDASSMVNVNTAIETGMTGDGDGTDGIVEFPRYPSEVDLYSLLFKEYDRLLGGGAADIDFINNGFVNHLDTIGALRFDSQSTPYIYTEATRLLADDRHGIYQSYTRNPDISYEGANPYRLNNEIELHSFGAFANDMAISRLEGSFIGLDLSSPFRDQWPHELNYSDDASNPDEINAIRGVRNLLTTYSGARSVAAWNETEDNAGIILKPDINAILNVEDDETPDLQPIVGGLMWALAPYAVEHGDPGANNVYNYIEGFNLSALGIWDKPTNGSAHYGTGDADFAFTRSAMLATNIADTYDENDDPTIRLFRRERIDSIPLDERREISGSFAHGRIPSAAESAGQNMTLIGTERHPFIREVATVHIYADYLSDLLGTDFSIIPNDLNYLFFELIAIEIGNPWDTDIDLVDYDFYIGDKLFETSGFANTIIAAGENVMFVRAAEDSLIAIDYYTNHWEPAISVHGASVEIRMVDPGVDNFLELDDTDTDVSIWRTDVNYGGLSGGTIDRVMVDRIRANQDGLPLEEKFPGILVGNYIYIDTGGGAGYAIMKNCSMRRDVARPNDNADNSFPAYVLQSPQRIADEGLQSTVFEDKGTLVLAPRVETFDSISLVDQLNRPDSTNKSYSTQIEFEPFQMLVANDKDIASVFDILTTNVVCGVNLGTNPVTDLPDTSEAGRDRYITLSEFLGDEDLANNSDLASHADVLFPESGGSFATAPDQRTLANGDTNPFIGKLDFTRDIPFVGTNALPHQAVPLAARVIDAFDTIGRTRASALVQGRININTAPQRVLETLPYIHPRFDAGPIESGDAGNIRLAEAIKRYRSRDASAVIEDIDWSDRAVGSNLRIRQGEAQGLRHDLTADAGFTSLGELALITQWLDHGTDTHRPNTALVDILNQSLTRPGHDSANTIFKPLNPNPNATLETPTNDPADDTSEWLALCRALSNSVTIRSDVYITYVKIIGFTPQDVLTANQQADELSVDPLSLIRPTMERRYMLMFDRSNVVLPSDRPRLLYAVQTLPDK